MKQLQRLTLRVIRALDAAFHRLYGWRWNPFHQSGTVAFALLLVLIVTGLYLLVVYRVGSPWESVSRLQADPWLGRWIRGVHRYASDLLVVAVAAHAIRLFAQERSSGPRALAWVSGIFLLALLLVSGWTGFVMVWDTFGAQLAVAGARVFDTLPVLSEPVARIFAGDRPVPPAFFFINLFLHVALPLGAAAGIWLHVSRIARPTLLPPRPLFTAMVLVLVVTAVVLPAPLPPKADPLAVPAWVPTNLFYAWWLPLAERVPPWAVWAGALGLVALALAVPRLTRPALGTRPPSVVDPRLCTGCNQCPQDCPWDAITMRERDDDRPSLVAYVNADLCVSCGICAGSCAPMGVGPPGRTGRDQVQAIRALARAMRGKPAAIVAVTCENAAPGQLDALVREGVVLHRVSCTGNLHSSVVEMALAAGAPGVIVYSCPPRDCRGREGPKWLEQRLFHDREAELQERVDRRRVATATMAVGEFHATLASLRALQAKVSALEIPGQDDDEPETVCRSAPTTAGEGVA